MDNLLPECSRVNFYATIASIAFVLLLVVDSIVREIKPLNTKTRLSAFVMLTSVTGVYITEGDPSNAVFIAWCLSLHTASLKMLILYFCEIFVPLYIDLPGASSSRARKLLEQLIGIYKWLRLSFVINAIVISTLFAFYPTNLMRIIFLSIDLVGYPIALLVTCVLMLRLAWVIRLHRVDMKNAHESKQVSRTKQIELQMVAFALLGIAICAVGIDDDSRKIAAAAENPSANWVRKCSTTAAVVIGRNALVIIGLFLLRAKSAEFRPFFKRCQKAGNNQSTDLKQSNSGSSGPNARASSTGARRSSFLRSQKGSAVSGFQMPPAPRTSNAGFVAPSEPTASKAENSDESTPMKNGASSLPRAEVIVGVRSETEVIDDVNNEVELSAV